ncbi:queuosine precursor transporter [uncultured Clostridium sp.]|uniref:queuosine precursor transporter n=1 Tax=uncultured Clostridium sp. TaxID=59620 RepID=UPI00262275BE|nr:queuosine precursor transporter [uncultured Clostridium sp.]
MKEFLKKLSNISLTSWLLIIVGFYLAGSVMQNIMAVKSFGSAAIAITTGGTLISWIVFGCIDMVTEVWGKNKAIKVFFYSALLNLFFTAFCWIAIAIPGTSPDFIDPQYKTILGSGWRIIIASISAFLLGTYTNTIIMHVMKTKSKDSNNSFGFMLRSTVSTLVGQFIDNFLFYLIAFAPLGITLVEKSWIIILELAGFTTLIETIVQAIASPLAAKFANYLKKKKTDNEQKQESLENKAKEYDQIINKQKEDKEVKKTRKSKSTVLNNKEKISK